MCKTQLIFLLLSISLTLSCSQQGSNNKEEEDPKVSLEKANLQPDLTMDNLLAWCIVPFDAKERSPGERINMLKELGFTQYAYDWRAKHLDEMKQEIQLARDNNIDMMAVWVWIDSNSDSPGNLSEANEQIFSILKETELKTQLWLGFSAGYFENLPEDEAIGKAVEMITYLAERASEVGGTLTLYNHGGWFGEPENQVRIIEKIPGHTIGIVYNFHHAHEQIDRLPEIIAAMEPYLRVVNLNGMVKDGPKILPLGEGDLEKDMIDQFLSAGFNGPWGILGHVEERDVKEVLEENLKGLKEMYE